MLFEPDKCDACKIQYECAKPFENKKACDDQILSASVYTDGLRMVGDSIEVLHNFAYKIHLPRKHYTDAGIPMYYLPDWQFKELAFNAKAIKVSEFAIEKIGIFTEGRNVYSRETGKIIKQERG